jgi:transcriptional regulator with XRE-family HTH domain
MQKTKKTKITEEGKLINSILAKNFKIIRKIKGLSLNEMGEILGVSGQQAQKYETGRTQISITSMTKLAIYCNIPVITLMEAIDLERLENFLK